MELAVIRDSWRKSKRILAAQESANGIENRGHLTLKARKPGIASGHIGKLSELILGLEIAGAPAVARSQIYVFAHSDGENGDIGFLQPFVRIIESVFAESVEAGGEQQNRFLPAHVAHLIKSF